MTSADDAGNPSLGANLLNTASVSANGTSLEQATAAVTIDPTDPPTIGYWESSKGQALIKSLNGSASATKLSHWLATTFANLYGASAGKNDLVGKTNTQVAAYYDALAVANQEVLATALSVYASSSKLAGGTMGKSAGLPVSAAGIGGVTLNVGHDGTALGLRNDAMASIQKVLQDVNAAAHAGILYGTVAKLTTRNLDTTEADDLFAIINEPTF